ncbi:hypothetical protein Hanom_Chr00s000004g01609171 [Helianthus anomalus]
MLQIHIETTNPTTLQKCFVSNIVSNPRKSTIVFCLKYILYVMRYTNYTELENRT